MWRFSTQKQILHAVKYFYPALLTESQGSTAVNKELGGGGLFVALTEPGEQLTAQSFIQVVW